MRIGLPEEPQPPPLAGTLRCRDGDRFDGVAQGGHIEASEVAFHLGQHAGAIVVADSLARGQPVPLSVPFPDLSTADSRLTSAYREALWLTDGHREARWTETSLVGCGR